MPQSPAGDETFWFAPVHHNLEGHWGYANKNPAGEGIVEPKMKEDRFDEALVYPVVGLLEV